MGIGWGEEHFLSSLPHQFKSFLFWEFGLFWEFCESQKKSMSLASHRHCSGLAAN